MKLRHSLLNIFRERTTPENEPDAAGIDIPLEAQRRQLHATDPETAHRWQSLDLAISRDEAPAQARTARRAGLLLRPAFAFGLAGAVLAAAGVVWLMWPSSSIYTTGRGQQTEILLADSSQVIMNHTSRLTVDRRLLTGDRNVSLEGEAYFDVRATGQSFVVSTSAGTVRVLGTEFNVRVREDRLEVAVVRGSVRVTGHHSGGDSSVVLAEGQKTICRRGEGPGTPGTIPLAGYPGWIHGQLLFEKVPLLSACREIESRFDVVITIRNRPMQGQTLTGVLDARSADAAIATLSQLTGLQYRHDTNGYTLY